MSPAETNVATRTSVQRPLRHLLEQELRGLGVGEALPPIRLLQQKAGVGRVRLERVLREFEKQGRIERRSRSGIYKASEISGGSSLSMVELIICDYQGDAYRGSWFAASVVQAVSEQAGTLGLGVRFRQFPHEAPVEAYQSLASETALRGAILIYPHMPDLASIFERHGIATVSLYPRIIQRNATNILLSPRRFVSCQLEHLLELGHTRIAYFDQLKPDPQVVNTEQLLRREGYYRIMAERGLAVAPHWVQQANGEPENISKAMEAIFGRRPYPTALVVSDNQLPTVYRFIESRGWQVGRDISVMGTDDLPEAVQVDPPATTVRNPRDRIAARAFEILEGRLAHKDAPSRLTVEPSLIVRQSTGPCNPTMSR